MTTNPGSQLTDPPHEIVVVTQHDCHFCDQATEILHSLAQYLNFTTYAIGLDTEPGFKLAERGGMLFPPGIFLDGELLSYGRPSRRRLRRDLVAHGVPFRDTPPAARSR